MLAYCRRALKVLSNLFREDEWNNWWLILQTEKASAFHKDRGFLANYWAAAMADALQHLVTDLPEKKLMFCSNYFLGD